MIGRISDKQVLLSISPAQIMAYLRSRGARQVDEFLGKAAVWSYGDEELLVPLATRFADYAARMADILAALEREEDRSQLQIITELKYSCFDGTSACIKDTEPEPEQMVRGLVTGLESDNPRETGVIKIKDVMASRPRLLLVELSGEDYTRALAAHASRKLVELTGTVTRSGRTLRLVADSPLTIVEDNA